MVFFNYATMQMAAKIVYYGPGLCGKTTNLHHIYSKTSPQSRGEMVSLETETDRTLFFDLLPLDVGVIGGFKTRLQLYTVPGQVFYNTTRKLVLKGVDGIVYVADSQRAMLDANIESLRNLRTNLKEIGQELDELPMIFQLNKRDLPNIIDKETMIKSIDPSGLHEYVEAAAVTGEGVFETLKLISKLTLRTIRRRMMGDESASAAPAVMKDTSTRPTPALQPHAPPKPPPARPVSTSAKTVAMPMPVIASAARAAAAPSQSAKAAQVFDEPEEINAADEIVEAAEEISESALVEELPPAPEPPAELSPAPEPDIVVSETERAPRGEPPVKHVRVRSSIDIMAELESLRKKSTQGPSRGRKDATASRAEVVRHMPMKVKNAASRSRAVRLLVTFEDGVGGEVQQQEQRLELENESDMQSLQLHVKIDFESDTN